MHSSVSVSNFEGEGKTSSPSSLFYDIKTRLRVNCGCGASFSSVSDGERHAQQTTHTLHILGEIRVNKT